MLQKCLAAAVLMLAVNTTNASDAVILLYHRVANEGPSSTRVSPEQFEAHLDLIAAAGYQVIPLKQLLAGVYEQNELPQRALAITFDDAYRSVGELAYPLLRERHMPFTIFVATDVVDAGVTSFLSWAQLTQLASDPAVTFGGHSSSHAHLESLTLARRDRHQLTSEREREIDDNFQTLQRKLGDNIINAFAYPYGEYSRGTEKLLEARQLYGLAQQSGAVSSEVAKTRIPRFPMALAQGSDSRLLTALQSRALSILREDPMHIVIGPAVEAPKFWRFLPKIGDYKAETLRCYASSGESLALTLHDDWVSVALPKFTPGRNKVNCTAPVESGVGYYWISRLWLVTDASGKWLDS